MTKQILMVAEKPSIANSIAYALSKNNKTRSGKTPIHEFDGTFENKPAKYKVTSVTGHIYSCDFPNEYSNWDAVDPKTLFKAPTLKKTEGQGIVKQLQSEAKGVDVLVLWLDCDREGENICFEVIDLVKPKMKKNADGSATILRAKFSAVTKSDIDRAMSNLCEPNKNESLAVDARQELDLKVGVAFSRFQTRYFQGKYGDLDSSVVSYGPCQTPTLGFCVERHDEIQQFQSETFWTIECSLSKGGQTVNLEWARGRLFDQEATHMFLGLLKPNNHLIVSDVKKANGSRSRPVPLNTVKLLQEASKVLNMGAFTTMQTAERLYLQGYISYPRTESTSYPDSYDIGGALAVQKSNSSWGSYVQELLRSGYQRPKKGVDVGDHPPITPVRSSSGELSGDQARLFDFITRYFIATVSPDAKMMTTKYKFIGGDLGGGEEFSASGVIVLHKGFTEILTSTTLSDQYLPEFTVGDKIPISTLKVRSGQTSPPGYLTESELIGLMEKNGIGTDASIPTHINNIMQRNYVKISQGRTLIPTDLGIVLAHGYFNTDPELVLPKVRAAIEQQCTLIAQGKATKEDVLEHSLTLFEQKFSYFVPTGKSMAKCGKCSRYMKYVRLKPQRLHCATCNETYALPQNGTIKLFKELKCPLDNFELVVFSLGNSEKAMGKSYTLCPYCFNYPPFDGMSKMGCNSCLHPTCQHSLTLNGICPCPGEEKSESPCSGTMVLDQNSKPNWKMSCNECNLIIRFQGNFHNIKPMKKVGDSGICDDCGSSILEIEFHKDKSPLPGETCYRGCVMCDDFLSSLTELRKGRFKHLKLSRRGGRRGRGRGRGRGRKKGDPLMSFEDF